MNLTTVVPLNSYSAADESSTSPPLTSSMVLGIARSTVFVLSIVSFCLNCLIVAALVLASQKHANTRLILANNSAAAVIWNTAQIVKSIYFFIYRGQDDKFAVTTLDCILQELVASSAVRAAIFSIVGIALERLLATKSHANYERRSFILGLGFVILCWLQGVSWIIASIILTNQNPATSSGLQPYCINSLATNAILLGCNISFFLGCSVGSVIGFYLVLRASRRLLGKFKQTRMHLSLSSRMQLKHSLELTLEIAPCVSCHAVVMCSLQVYALSVLFATAKFNFSDRLGFLAMIDVWIAFYFMLDAVLLVTFSRTIRQKLVQCLLTKLVVFKMFKWHQRLCHQQQLDLENASLPAFSRSISIDRIYLDDLVKTWNVIVPTMSAASQERQGHVFKNKVEPDNPPRNYKAST